MAGPPPVLTLVVEKGPRKGQSLQHRAGTVLLVGRVVKGNDLAVGDSGASQRHLDLAFLPPPASVWAATDVGSSNGTLLNGTALVPTVPAPLSDGDRIKIGESTVLAVSIAADAGPEPVAPRRSKRQAAAVVEEESKAPAVTRGRRKAPAAVDQPKAVKGEAEVATRRGRQKKAPAVADPPEEKEEAAVVPHQGGRKRAPAVAESPEEEKEEAAVVPRRGGRKKAVEAEREEEEEVRPQPQPQTSRTTRAAARRAEAVGPGQGKGEARQTERGRGKVSLQIAKKAEEAMHEDEEEGEVAVLEVQKGTTAKSVRENDDKVENGDGTSNALAVQAALSKPAERTRKGRGRVRGSARKAKDPVNEEDDEKEEEDGDVVGVKEGCGNPPQVAAPKGGNEKEDKRTTGSGEVDEASKAEADQVAEEGDAPLAPSGQIQISPNKRAGTKGAPVDRDKEGKESGRKEGSSIVQESRGKRVPKSKPDGVGGAGDDGKMELSGAGGEEEGVKGASKCSAGCSAERCDLENMTLREWFARIEKYLMAKNHELAQKAIAEVEEKHRRMAEYIKTLK